MASELLLSIIGYVIFLLRPTYKIVTTSHHSTFRTTIGAAGITNEDRRAMNDIVKEIYEYFGFRHRPLYVASKLLINVTCDQSYCFITDTQLWKRELFILNYKIKSMKQKSYLVCLMSDKNFLYPRITENEFI